MPTFHSKPLLRGNHQSIPIDTILNVQKTHNKALEKPKIVAYRWLFSTQSNIKQRHPSVFHNKTPNVEANTSCHLFKCLPANNSPHTYTSQSSRVARAEWLIAEWKARAPTFRIRESSLRCRKHDEIATYQTKIFPPSRRPTGWRAPPRATILDIYNERVGGSGMSVHIYTKSVMIASDSEWASAECEVRGQDDEAGVARWRLGLGRPWGGCHGESPDTRDHQVLRRAVRGVHEGVRGDADPGLLDARALLFSVQLARWGVLWNLVVVLDVEEKRVEIALRVGHWIHIASLEGNVITQLEPFLL